MECETYYYLNSTSKTCEPCGTYCLYCPSVDLCEECESETYLLPNKSSCVTSDNCPDGYYPSSSLSSCEGKKIFFFSSRSFSSLTFFYKPKLN